MNNNRATTKKALTTALLLAGGLLVTTSAEARRFGRGMGGPGMGGHGGMGGPGRCARMLMKAHPDHLKEQLGVNDAQLAKLKALRNNFISKRINLKAQAAQQRLKLRNLMEQDLPPQNKVLKVMRKMRSVRGVMMEEGVKAALKGLATLTPEQRKKLRSQCAKHPRHKRGKRWHRGGRGGRGGGWHGRRGRGGPGGGGPGRGQGDGPQTGTMGF